MQIMRKKTERTTIFLALLALGAIGLSLFFATWQALSRQTEAEEQHLLLSGRTVFFAVESILQHMPLVRTTGSGSFGTDQENAVSEGSQADSRTTEFAKMNFEKMQQFFVQLEKSGEVVFAGLLRADGSTLMVPAAGEVAVVIPETVRRLLVKQAEWHGFLQIDAKPVYVYGGRLGNSSEEYLLIGLAAEKLLEGYEVFRRNAYYQAFYIFCAALIAWGFAISFLARRDQAKKAIRLEQFQAALLDALPDGLITLETTGNDLVISSANPAALIILGTQAERLIGYGLSVLPQELARIIEQRISSALVGGWQCLAVREMALEVLVETLPEDERSEYVMLIRDRTQLRNLEHNLLQAEKMAAIGRLAAGVAHEVRNPLSALRGFAQYFLKKLTGKQPEESYARSMMQEADRLNRVITDLLYLARPRPLSVMTLDVSLTVDEVRTLLHLELEQRGIVLKQRLSTPSVYADADALKQSLLNLFLNSIESIDTVCGKRQGVITISSETVAGGVLLEVTDNGGGMKPDQLMQVCEPFFTDKPLGTGLGLALVQRMMLDLGGYVEIKAKEGESFTVSLFFPSFIT